MNNIVLKEILQNIIDPCAKALKISTTKIDDAKLENGKIYLVLKGGNKITVNASAIYFLLNEVFKNKKGFNDTHLWVQAGSPLHEIINGIYPDDSEQMLKLIEFLVDANELEEAKLCALQFTIYEDFRIDSPIGKKLFAKSKLKSSEKLNHSSSEASAIENLFPFTKSKNLSEVVFSVSRIISYVVMALFVTSGKRKEKLIVMLQTIEHNLKMHPHQTLQSYSSFFAKERELKKWY